MIPVCITGDIDTGEEIHETDLLPLLELLASHEVRMTVPVTASVLRSNLRGVSMILDEGHELAGHGDVHTPFHDPLEVQVKRLERMIDEFEHCLGIRPLGFRAPFLEHNKDTYSALETVRLRYDSSRTWSDPRIVTRATLGRAYSHPAHLGDLPRIWGRHLVRHAPSWGYLVAPSVIELPVFDLDDWFFLDAPRGPRLVPDAYRAISNHWTNALGHLAGRHDAAMIIQAHPKRMHRGLLAALDDFISTAKRSRATFLTLAELHSWYSGDSVWRKKNSLMAGWV